MPTLTFTQNNDIYTVRDPGTYILSFLGGEDRLNVHGGTFTTASMGEGNDVVDLQAGDGLISGDSGADTFEIVSDGWEARGGSDNDTFNLRGGNNLTLYGDGGNDRFELGAAALNVFIDAGDGHDDISAHGWAVSGVVHGGAGNDTFYEFRNVGGNVVTLHGGTGNDAFRVANSNVALVELAGEGSDTVYLSRGINYTLPTNVENLKVITLIGSSIANARIVGNDLNNSMVGHANAETIYGLDGNDRLYGKGGNDNLLGGHGNDVVDGGAGDDRLDGGTGNDFLVGRTGNDSMVGGTGNDIYYVDSIDDGVTENSGEGSDTVRVTVGDYVLGDNVENGAIAVATGLRLDGNSLANQLYGGNGNDTLNGHEGNDVIRGAGGNDTINGGTGNDTISGGAGNDQIEGEAGDDTLFGDAGDDYLCGGPGEDTLDGGEGNDTICSENATVRGGIGSDIFLFDTTITGTGSILDFLSVDDSIVLDLTVFPELGGLLNLDGTLLADAFVSGTVALDLNDRVIFDAATGNIFFDPDGIGLLSAELIANVGVGTVLVSSDIFGS